MRFAATDGGSAKALVHSLASRRDADPPCRRAVKSWAQDNVDSRWAVEGDSWDLELILLQLAASRGKEERKQSLGICLAKRASGSGEGRSGHIAERCAEVILEALRGPKDGEERKAFIESHLHLDRVRDAAIDDALAAADFKRAELLAREGMAAAGARRYGGLADDYARRLVEVLDASGARDKANEFIEARSRARESIEWFKALKKRIRKGDLWITVRERILGALSPTGILFQAEILAEERLLERLCELARSHPDVMQVHYKLIGRLFPNDAAKYLENKIRRELERAHSRNGYRAIAAELREYRGFAGAETAADFVEELCASYVNRPAMIEELKRASGARGRGPSPERR